MSPTRSVDRPSFTRVSISRMRPRHLAAVHAIECSVYARPWAPGVFESELAQRDSRWYVVARVEREIVGYAGMMLVVDEAHITTVVVRPAWRRQGIARALVHNLLFTARARGADAATLEVRVTNTAAQELYRSFGFAPVGLRPRYYEDTGEDALIMWLHELQSGEVRDRLDLAGPPAPPRFFSWTAGGR